MRIIGMLLMFGGCLLTLLGALGASSGMPFTVIFTCTGLPLVLVGFWLGRKAKKQ